MLSRRGFLTMLPLVGARIVPSRSVPREADREVLLLECPVAGFRFHDGPRIESRLSAGDRLRLVREVSNPHDERAVAIHVMSGERLGYVPFHLNAIPSRLLDGGVALCARIASIAEAPAPPWKRVRAALYVVQQGARG